MQVTIKMHEGFDLDHFATKSSPDSSGELITDGVKDGGINGGINGGNKTVVVNMLKNEPAITVSDISKQSGIPIRSVERIISQLKQDGIVERMGAKKAGYWRVLPDE